MYVTGNPCGLGRWPTSRFSSSQLCNVKHVQTALELGHSLMLHGQPTLLQPALLDSVGIVGRALRRFKLCNSDWLAGL